MCSDEQKRFKLHERLIALDASNIELMKLVVLDMVGSEDWAEAVEVLRSTIADLEDAFGDQDTGRVGTNIHPFG